ncbi:hypothetical protein FXO38_07066 [Capsicum annuum]|nr:hypothetical protein FXO37_12329 [Capsicum annuum]KAF3670470.1 hypothetical protein FXO38_07066 [Capsicum annuum]
MMGSNLQSRIVGEEDDLEQIQVATQDFEPYGPDVGNKEDPPLRPMVYPESESSVEKVIGASNRMLYIGRRKAKESESKELEDFGGFGSVVEEPQRQLAACWKQLITCLNAFKT